MSETETYHFEVSIRIDGARLKDRNGLLVPSIKLTKTFDPLFLDTVMKRLFLDFEAITSEGADINIGAYLENTISDSWMCMASYYGSEERFVTH